MKKGIIALIIVLVVLIGGCLAFYFVSTGPVNKNDDGIIVVKLENGSGTASIAAKLEEEGLIKNSFMFRVKSKLSGSDGEYKAGSFAVKKSMSMGEIMDLIISGKTVGKTFVIPEANTVEKDSVLLQSKGFVDAEDFLNEVANGDFDYRFIEGLPAGTSRLEGFLYPDQYQVSLEADAHEIINVMLKQFNNVFTDEYYAKAEKMDMSVLEVMTVASIIEKEAKTKEDKLNVASVIYNRLEDNMPLQMDSILAYIHKEDKIKASLADTQVKSDYNPYTNKGLPPGPICSPGMDSIYAALNPADTDYIYFVAGEKLDGTNVFSVTYEEFLKDKAKFDKAYKEYIKKHPDKV